MGKRFSPMIRTSLWHNGETESFSRTPRSIRKARHVISPISAMPPAWLALKPLSNQSHKTVKTLTLNLGLQTNTGDFVRLTHALRCLVNRFELIDLKIENSHTEKTIVCVIQFVPSYVERLHELCDLLEQDCIAIFDGKHGELIGPNAAKWGNFNPDFFINF